MTPDGTLRRSLFDPFVEERHRPSLEEARVRGCRFLAVDAAPMSRPILQHKGFMFVGATYPMKSEPRAKRSE